VYHDSFYLYFQSDPPDQKCPNNINFHACQTVDRNVHEDEELDCATSQNKWNDLDNMLEKVLLTLNWICHRNIFFHE
jgi:hypothetical protein